MGSKNIRRDATTISAKTMLTCCAKESGMDIVVELATKPTASGGGLIDGSKPLQ